MRIHAKYHPYLVFLGTIGLLFAIGTQEQSVDSYGYAGFIRDGHSLLHPHHIAYNWVCHQLMVLLQGLGFEVDAMQVGRGHNIIAAGVTVAFLFSLFKRLGKQAASALLFAAVLLFSFGFWKLSAVVEVYVPGLMCMAIATWLLAGLASDRFSIKDAVLLALALMGAVAYHQANVLFSFPIAAYLVLFYGKSGWLHAAKVLIPAGLGSLGLYVLASAQSGYPLGMSGLYEYMFRYSIEDHPGWGSLSNLGPAGWFALFKSQIGAFILSRYSGVFLYQLLYGGALLGLLVWSIRQAVRGGFEKREGAMRKTLLLWLISHFLFFCWWLPQEGEFFIVSLFPLILLLSYLLDDARRNKGSRRAVPIFFLLLFLLQLGLNAQYIFLERDRHIDPKLQADAIHEVCPEKCFTVDKMHHLGRLRFHHGNPGKELILAMRPAYGLEPESPVIDYAAQECVLVYFEEVGPKTKHLDRDGFSHPAEWWRYFVRLADFKALASGGFEAREVEALDIRGQVYLKFSAHRTALISEEELVNKTINALETIEIGERLAGDLKLWISEFRVSLTEF